MTTSNHHEKTNRVTYPLLMGYLPPKFVDKVKTELNETPEIRNEGIQQIRKLLREERNINDEWFSDDVIVTYLRGRKYRIKEVISAMKKMIAFVRKHEDLYFKPMKPDTIRKCWECEYMRLSAVRNEDGCVVATHKLSNWNPSEIEMEHLLNYSIRNFLYIISDPMTQVNGIILLYDFTDSFNLRYLPYANPSMMKLIYNLFVECMPVRFKGAHIMYPNAFTKLAVSAMRKLLPEKLMKRVYVHDKVENITNHIDASAIPYEYGGNLHPHEMRNDWMKTTKHPDYVRSIIDSKRQTS